MESFLARSVQLQNSHIREGMRGREVAEQPLVFIQIDRGCDT
jgi:hypothetical protein